MWKIRKTENRRIPGGRTHLGTLWFKCVPLWMETRSHGGQRVADCALGGGRTQWSCRQACCFLKEPPAKERPTAGPLPKGHRHKGKAHADRLGAPRKVKPGVAPGIQMGSDATGPGETEPAGEACPVGSSSNGHRDMRRPGARPGGTARRGAQDRQSRTCKHASEAPDRPEAMLLRQVPEQSPRTGRASDLLQPTQWLPPFSLRGLAMPPPMASVTRARARVPRDSLKLPGHSDCD